MKTNVFIIIPSIRNLDFLKKWKDAFSECNLVVVEDNLGKSIKIPAIKTKSVIHLSWEDIEKSLGKNSWIISRKNAGIRSFGFLKAYELGAEVIITLDDDCYPIEENFIKKHIDNLSFRLPESWVNTYPKIDFIFTRGTPYLNRNRIPVVISHGLWSGSIDLDAKTELNYGKKIDEKPIHNFRQIIPFNYYYPMCSMNLAFKREVTPIMYLPLMGKDSNGMKWKYDRYDDIWAGIFSKKILDHINYGVLNGSPFVKHIKASNINENLKKEKNGMRFNEKLWKLVEEVNLTKDNPKDCYIELARKIKFPKERYFEKLREAMIIWANLF